MTIRCVSSRLPKRVFLSFAAMSIALAACGPALIGAALGGGGGGGGGGGTTQVTPLQITRLETNPRVARFTVSGNEKFESLSYHWNETGDEVPVTTLPASGPFQIEVLRLAKADRIVFTGKVAGKLVGTLTLPLPAVDAHDITLAPVEASGTGTKVRWTAPDIDGLEFSVFRDTDAAKVRSALQNERVLDQQGVTVTRGADAGGRRTYEVVDAALPAAEGGLVRHYWYGVRDKLGWMSQVVSTHSLPAEFARSVDEIPLALVPPPGGRTSSRRGLDDRVGVPPFLVDWVASDGGFPGADGLPDLLLVGRDGSVSVAANTGTAIASPTQLLGPGSVAANPVRVLVGDFDRSGDSQGVQDLVVVGAGSVRWIVGGMGPTPPLQSRGWDGDELSVLLGVARPDLLDLLDAGVGDLDGDGETDLVLSYRLPSTDSFALLVIRRAWLVDRSFALLSEVRGGPGSFVCADLDMDGKTDLALTSDDHHVVLLDPLGGAARRELSNSAALQSREAIRWDQVACRDIDRDGDLDLLVIRSNEGAGTVVSYRNDGDRLSETSTLDLGTRVQIGSSNQRGHLQFADMDRDGLEDLVLRTVLPTAGTGLEYSASVVSVFSGTQDSEGNQNWTSWALPQRLDFGMTGGVPHVHCAIADLDDDGLPDVSVVHAAEPQTTPSMWLFTQESRPTRGWVSPSSTTAGLSLAGALEVPGVADVTVASDGRLLVPVAIGAFTEFLPGVAAGRRTGGFSAINRSAPLDVRQAVFATAIEGQPQLLALRVGGEVRRLQRSGSDYGYVPAGWGAVPDAKEVYPATLDGDLLADAICRSGTAAGTTIHWLRSVGASSTSVAIGDADQFAAADVDQDGFTDFLAANVAEVKLWRREAPTEVRWQLGNDVVVTSLAAGNVRGRATARSSAGLPIVVGTSDGRVLVIANPLGPAPSTTAIDVSSGNPIVGLQIGDLNGDRHLDIVAITAAGAWVLLADATTNPPALLAPIPLALPEGTPPTDFRQVRLTTVDGDPHLDILIRTSDQLLFWTPRFGQSPPPPR